MYFLMGLNDLFSQLRSQFLSTDHLPALSKIFSLVFQEERQRELGTNVVPDLPTSEVPSMFANATQGT